MVGDRYWCDTVARYRRALDRLEAALGEADKVLNVDALEEVGLRAGVVADMANGLALVAREARDGRNNV